MLGDGWRKENHILKARVQALEDMLKIERNRVRNAESQLNAIYGVIEEYYSKDFEEII